jgi:hypothetical protein
VGGAGPHRYNVGLIAAHVKSRRGDTDHRQADHRRRLRLRGRRHGITIVGTYNSGGTGDVNIYLDDIVDPARQARRRLRADRLCRSGNFHVGSRGYCGKVTVTDCDGINSGDVGIEIDGAQTACSSATAPTDSYNGGVLFANFKPAPFPESQLNICRDHEHVV